MYIQVVTYNQGEGNTKGDRDMYKDYNRTFFYEDSMESFIEKNLKSRNITDYTISFWTDGFGQKRYTVSWNED